MSLEEWLANRWLTRFQLADLERHKLLLAAERELRDAKLDLGCRTRGCGDLPHRFGNDSLTKSSFLL